MYCAPGRPREPALAGRGTLGNGAVRGENEAVQVSQGAMAYHFTTVGDGVDVVEQALLAVGATFTRTPVTVVWPGGRGEGVEFVFVLAGANQRTGLDLVQRLRTTGMWLLIRTVDSTTPA